VNVCKKLFSNIKSGWEKSKNSEVFPAKTNPKLQAPKTKFQITNTKKQIPNNKHQITNKFKIPSPKYQTKQNSKSQKSNLNPTAVLFNPIMITKNVCRGNLFCLRFGI
jgi:hypothetical protein